MKKSVFLAAVSTISLLAVSAASAQSVALSGSNSSSSSVSTGVNSGQQNNNMTATGGAGGSAGASAAAQGGAGGAASASVAPITTTATTGPSTATANTGSLTNTSPSSASLQFNQTIKSAPVLPNQVPGMSNVGLPSLFTNPGIGAPSAGAAEEFSAFQNGSADITLNSMTRMELTGKSGKTNLVITTLPAYAFQSDRGAVQAVSPKFAAGMHGYDVLGTITVEANKKEADSVDFSTLVYDAADYALTKLQVTSNASHPARIYMISVPQAMAMAAEVGSRSIGGGLSAFTTALSSAAAVAGGATPSFGLNKGIVDGSERVGTTFILLSIDDDHGMPIDPTALTSFYPQEKKADATEVTPAPATSKPIAPVSPEEKGERGENTVGKTSQNG